MAGERIGILASNPVKLRDNVKLQFGDGAQWDNRTVGDVFARWTGSLLEFLPTADDTGAINIGDGTTDVDLKHFLGNTLNYVLFDVGNAWLHVQHESAGGDSPKGMLIDVNVLAGNGFRQAGLQIAIDRASGQNFTWDGNPDAGLKILVNNRAANAANEGAVRAIDATARNRGTNVSWVNGGNISARNDSGMTAYQLIGIQTRLENYGTLETEAVGLDVNLSIENDTGAPTKTGILIRNTDLSGMTAVNEAIKISHTSTNGFTNVLNFAGASGDGIASGSLAGSGGADILCDARITIVWNGNTYYLAAYDTVV